jgi:hypothetical protein
MAADGSQYLVTNVVSATTRGETSSTNHTQTVTYNNQTDAQTRLLAAAKVQVSEQQQVSDGDSESERRVPRVVQVQFRVTFLGATVAC